VVNGTLCDHLYLARAEAEACRTKRENHRAPVMRITRARGRREGGEMVSYLTTPSFSFTGSAQRTSRQHYSAAVTR
jgi:hypothetical protein